MPDLRDKPQTRNPRAGQAGTWPGNNSELPNTEPTDAEALPGDVARDVSNEGVASDPKNTEQRLNP